MIGSKKIACVIPARLQSSRFPHKIIKNLNGKPLLWWAWNAAKQIPFFDKVIVAVDAKETVQAIDSFDIDYVMTSTSCQCGTDRVIEVMQKRIIDADIWVNWQADEPFINEKMIKQLLAACDEDNVDVWTLRERIFDEREINSVNVAKVVCDSSNFALYFSRSPIPFYRDGGDDKIYYKHIGLFAYTTEALKKISFLSPTPLEQAEKLEQLRFLQNNLRIKLHETDQIVIGVDTVEDLQKAEKMMKNKEVVF